MKPTVLYLMFYAHTAAFQHQASWLAGPEHQALLGGEVVLDLDHKRVRVDRLRNHREKAAAPGAIHVKVLEIGRHTEHRTRRQPGLGARPLRERIAIHPAAQM